MREVLALATRKGKKLNDESCKHFAETYRCAGLCGRRHPDFPVREGRESSCHT
jgi:hypothetical protein